MNTRTRCAVTLVGFVIFFFVGVEAQTEQGLRQLTDDPAQDGFPSWHPDGHSILFSRYGRDVAPEKTGLWLVAPDGSEPRRLTTVIGEHPDWSPDGRYIVFDGDFGNAIRLMAASGGTPVRIVPEWIPVERGGQPRWSPDGTRIAFKEGAVLWVLEITSGSFEKIFSEPSKRPIPTGWSADGLEIFVWLLDDETRRSDLWAIAVDEGTKRQVASETDAAYRYADLSPDGTLLAVVRCEGRSACDIWVMAPTGGARVQITSDPAYEDGPSWSPDGTKLAFVSTRSGNFDIWTVDVDVARVRRELERLQR